ncbi:hypothetical protein [Fusibacter tunisiensis]|uniref:Uncharacterized protein n=1 Tax=Fusibacter tunisiensis TaxID=1008308 RepID=A0ABS2MSI4_9FIRM|nr:hypothetical protein [Fusibacter tunisiensis]MBM7562315.1 hypothetical protein [Fusibacter tunisiensis]
MKKEVLDELAFEKSKREILRQNHEKMMPKQDESGERRYAWELELEQYRKSKRLKRYLILGATLGIISFVMQVVLILIEF